VIIRILIWSVADSKTTIDELRATLPELEAPSTWIWNEASERFGVVAFGDDLPEEIVHARELLGREPDIAEEFDAL
jgi:hypothetical protein